MAYIYDLTDTWNAGGTTFNAIKMNVTDSASAVSSKLVTLQTNGTEHFSVTKAGVGYVSGNLGVGTTIPSAKLEVARTDSAAGIRVTVGQGAYSGNVALFGVTGQSNGYYITKDAANNIQHIWDGTGGAERMRITSAGNVGIGTAAPGTKLDVVGPDNSGAQYRTSTRTIGIGSISGVNALYGGSGTELTFHIGSERMRIDSSGNVGIGTSSPSNKLQSSYTVSASLPAAGATGHGFAVGSSGFGLTAGALSTGNGYLQATRWDGIATNYNLLLQPNGGNVGIGTTTPGEKLRVEGNVILPISKSFYAYTNNYGIGTPDSNGLQIFTDASDVMRFGNRTGGTTFTEQMRIDTNGNLLVGTTDPGPSSGQGVKLLPTGRIYSVITSSVADAYDLYNTTAAAYRFYVNNAGTIFATSATITAISDIRLKENVRDLDTGLDTILALKPRRFDWKEGKGKDVKDDMGFIAQEVEEVLPELIGGWKAGEGEPDDLKSVKAGDLIPVLVKAIQELTARVAQLEGN